MLYLYQSIMDTIAGKESICQDRLGYRRGWGCKLRDNLLL